MPAGEDGLVGTITEFTTDDLGWIVLDGGERLRFGASSWRGERTEAALAVGVRVRVGATAAGFRGVIKALDVWPLVPPPPPAPPPVVPDGPPPPTWAELVAMYPRWSDVGDATLAPRVAPPPLVPPPPPALAAYHNELAATIPTVVGLDVAPWRVERPIAPTLADCFSHGTIAFLDADTWPACAACARPFEMCLQLSAEAIAPWVPGRGGLVAMFCFDCGTHATTSAGYVRFVRAGRRVEAPPSTHKTASSSPPRSSQRVTLSGFGRRTPSDSWYRYRAERRGSVPSAAAAMLHVADESDEVADIAAAVEAWENAVHAPLPGMDCLGGAPTWAYCDDTPSCPHGQMRQLVEYGGGQFLEGSLHVFVCIAGCDELAYVAEL